MAARDDLSARQIARKAIPIEKANVHNVAKNSGVNFLDSAIAPSTYINKAGTTIKIPALFRIQLSLDTAAVFKAKIIKGANTQTVSFAGGAQLTASCLYQFDLLVHSGDTVNFIADQNVNVNIFRVQEVAWAGQ